MKRCITLLLSVLMLLSLFWLPASLGGIKEAEATSNSLVGCTKYPLEGTAKLKNDLYLVKYPYADASRIGLLKASESQNMTVLGLWKNTSGIYWYEVCNTTQGLGTTGFVFAGNTEITLAQPTGFSVDSPTSPTSIAKGNGFHIKGTVKSNNHTITGIYAYVYKGKNLNPNYTGNTTVISSSVTGLSTKSYSIYNTTLDNKLKFGSLAAGDYTYVLKVAFNYNCSKDGKTLTQAAFSVNGVSQWAILSSEFKVVDNSSTPTVTSTETGDFTVLMPANKKILLYKNPGDSNNSTYFSARSEPFYCGCTKRSSMSDGSTWYFMVTGDDKSVWFKYTSDMILEYDSTQQVDVSFNPNGGSVGTSWTECTVGEAYGTLPTPTRTGHTFDGWYTAASGGSRVYSTTTVTTAASHTLYAHWTPNNYAVYFDAIGGSCSTDSKTVTYGGTYGNLPTPTWEGHDFSGWYTASSGGSRIYSSTTVTTAASHTLYAHWSMALPTITTQPANATVNQGKKATFKVVATGADSYKWQYQKPGESTWNDVIYNGTSATYNLTTAARHNGYKYRCKVTNAAGSVYSNTVTLTLATKPAITTQPKSVTVNVGAKATFKVAATGATSYKWQYQKPGSSTWTDVSNNGTSATYSLTTAARHNGYKYRCKVTNAAGTVTSSVVTLTVKTASKPTITTQPKSATVAVGTLAAFQVKASNATSYQWQYQKPGTSTWTNVANNGTSATYTLTTAARHNGYKYRCKVTNSAGTVYTSAVKLTVK